MRHFIQSSFLGGIPTLRGLIMGLCALLLAGGFFALLWFGLTAVALGVMGGVLFVLSVALICELVLFKVPYRLWKPARALREFILFCWGQCLDGEKTLTYKLKWLFYGVLATFFLGVIPALLILSLPIFLFFLCASPLLTLVFSLPFAVWSFNLGIGLLALPGVMLILFVVMIFVVNISEWIEFREFSMGHIAMFFCHMALCILLSMPVIFVCCLFAGVIASLAYAAHILMPLILSLVASVLPVVVLPVWGICLAAACCFFLLLYVAMLCIERFLTLFVHFRRTINVFMEPIPRTTVRYGLSKDYLFFGSAFRRLLGRYFVLGAARFHFGESRFRHIDVSFVNRTLSYALYGDEEKYPKSTQEDSIMLILAFASKHQRFYEEVRENFFILLFEYFCADYQKDDKSSWNQRSCDMAQKIVEHDIEKDFIAFLDNPRVGLNEEQQRVSESACFDERAVRQDIGEREEKITTYFAQKNYITVKQAIKELVSHYKHSPCIKDALISCAPTGIPEMPSDIADLILHLSSPCTDDHSPPTNTLST